MKLKNSLKIILICFAISVLLFIPYIKNSVISTHDISYHTNRIVSIAEGLKSGQFPVIIASELLDGFGYCNALFYPELFLYIPAFLILLGMDFLVSYKVFMFLTTFFTLLISYYSANLIFKNKYKAWMFVILYGTAFYRLTDTFVRGAVGEVLAMVFLPLVIAGFYEIVFGENKRWWIIALGLFGVVNSHVLTLAMCAALIIVLVLINIIKIFKDKKKLINLIIAGIVSILLSLSFVLPYLEQSRSDHFIVDEKGIYSPEFVQERSVTLHEMINVLPARGDYYKGMGAVLIIISLLIVFQLRNKEKESTYMKELFFIGAIFYFLASRFFPWEQLCWKHMSLTTIQFPYRFYIVASALFAFVASYSITSINKVLNNKVLIYVLYTILIVYSVVFVMKINVNAFKFEKEEILGFAPIGNAEYEPTGFKNSDKTVHNIATVDQEIEFERNGDRLEFDYDDSQNEMIIHIPLTYYKGYYAYISFGENNNQMLIVEEDPVTKNIIVKSDEILTGHIVVEYHLTFIQVVSYLVTLFTLIIVIINMIYFKRINEVIEESSDLIKEVEE